MRIAQCADCILSRGVSIPTHMEGENNESTMRSRSSGKWQHGRFQSEDSDLALQSNDVAVECDAHVHVEFRAARPRGYERHLFALLVQNVTRLLDKRQLRNQTLLPIVNGWPTSRLIVLPVQMVEVALHDQLPMELVVHQLFAVDKLLR